MVIYLIRVTENKATEKNGNRQEKNLIVYRNQISTIKAMQNHRPIMSADLVFPEENLTFTAAQGFGFFVASPGLTLKNGYYKITRKLGRGRFSSTWLVSNHESGYVDIFHSCGGDLKTI